MIQVQVSFGEAIKRAFTVNYCNFTGRASRSEYWWFALFTGLISFAINIITGVGSEANSIVTGIFGLATMLPSLGLVCRRLHDTGRSGWMYVIMTVASLFLAAVGIIFMENSTVLGGLFIAACIIPAVIVLVWLCQPSQPTENQYGEVPNVE